MAIDELETSKVLLDYLFLSLALSSFGIMEQAITKLANYSEVCISIVSFYDAVATVFTRTLVIILPIENRFDYLL